MPSHTFKRLVWKTVHVTVTQRPEMTDIDQINELYNLIFHKKDLGLFLRPRWTVQVRLHPRNKRGKINIPKDQTMSKISPKITHLAFGLLPFSQISSLQGELNLDLTSPAHPQLPITYLLH